MCLRKRTEVRQVKDLRISRHAEWRCARQGVSQSKLNALLSRADREVPVGGGAISLNLSRAAAAACGIDGIGRLAAIVADNTLVTVLPTSDGPAGRRYRRGVQ